VAFWSSVLLAGVLAFAVSSILYMPVGLLAHHAAGLPADGRLSGSLRRGAAELGGGHRLTWRLDAGRSLAALGLAGDLRLEGPGTALAGAGTANLRGLALRGVAGEAAWPLLAALRPGLPVDCALSARLLRLDLRAGAGARAGDGAAEIGPGTCRGPGGAAPVPALTARLITTPAGLRAVLALAADATPLATGTLTPDDRLRLTVHAAGAALVPGMPASADSEIDMPLSLLGG
jgi:hypothetical protein